MLLNDDISISQKKKTKHHVTWHRNPDVFTTGLVQHVKVNKRDLILFVGILLMFSSFLKDAIIYESKNIICR